MGLRHRTVAALAMCALAASLGGIAHAGEGVIGGAHVEPRILSYAISPNGKCLAEIEVGGAVAGPRVRIAVRRLDASATSGRTIFLGHGVGAVQWMNDRDILFVQTVTGTRIIVENVKTGAKRTVFQSSHAISVVAHDWRRGLIAYEYSKPWRWGHRISVRMTDEMTTLELIVPAWARWPGTEVVGALKLKNRGAVWSVRRIALRGNRFMAPFPPTLLWERGRLLALESSMRSWRTRIFDLETGKRVDRSLPFFRLVGISIAESHHMAILATHLWKSRSRVRCGCGSSMKLFLVDTRGQVRELSAFRSEGFVEYLSGFWWAGDERLFVQVLGSKRSGGAIREWLDEVDTHSDEIVRSYFWPGGDLGGVAHPCEFDATRTRAICVAQTLTTPPALVEIDLPSGTTRVLGRIDPHQHRLDFSFTKIRISNRFGRSSTGFLALPKGARAHAIPLAVMAYGFSEAYSRTAQWISSYPVSKLVRSGIAVLLMNWAKTGAARLHLSSYENTKRAAESALSLFANAVPAVQARGVRVSRAMVMGWSFGGLFAAHAIQTLPEYVAAQVGDPAAYDVTQYALSNEFWRHVSDRYFGGPPVGRYLDRYEYMDPAGDGKPALGPILFEFVSNNPGAGQLLEEWRAVGTDVEAFAYRHSAHSLTVPAEAHISRLRNLYWAKMNLLGPQSVTATELRSVGLTVPPKAWWVSKGVSHCGRARTSSRRCGPKSASIVRPRGMRAQERVVTR